MKRKSSLLTYVRGWSCTTLQKSLTVSSRILSRAHSNYLAQINILMNERQEHTADVLGKLTVLGTIVLPMNIICGMWGMNVKVPGQDIDSLTWFWCSMSSLFSFPDYLLILRSYCRTMRICICICLDC
jgi:magnesium transporter